MTQATFKLTGQSLVDFVNGYDLDAHTRTEMILEAGYAYDNGKAMYTEFYTELLRAKGTTPVTDTDVVNSNYEDLDRDVQKLYDLVDKQHGEKWDHDEVMEFLDELSDIGIDTADQYEDFFYGVYDSEKEFAEEFCNEVEQINTDSSYYFAIDWQCVWDHNLRYDFDTIEFDYSTYFFRKG